MKGQFQSEGSDNDWLETIRADDFFIVEYLLTAMKSRLDVILPIGERFDPWFVFVVVTAFVVNA